jgi:hypothetical protein
MYINLKTEDGESVFQLGHHIKAVYFHEEGCTGFSVDSLNEGEISTTTFLYATVEEAYADFLFIKQALMVSEAPSMERAITAAKTEAKPTEVKKEIEKTEVVKETPEPVAVNEPIGEVKPLPEITEDSIREQLKAIAKKDPKLARSILTPYAPSAKLKDLDAKDYISIHDDIVKASKE